MIDFTQLGPDKVGNLHQHRPYFLLPLRVGAKLRTGASRRELRELPDSETALAKSLAEAMARIKAHAAAAPVTDVYVLSHGWHRNFYSAVAAYDRLGSRWAVLLERGKLPLPTARELYNPLLVTLHWSSEIGVDGWVDLSGRRDKVSFLGIAAGYWDDSQPDFLNVFEEIFELFSALCAPDVDALDAHLTANSENLWKKLAPLELKGCLGDLDQGQRVALAWKCYHEATATGVHIPQETQAAPFAGFDLGMELILKFLVGAGLVVVVLPKLLSAFFTASSPISRSVIRRLEGLFPGFPHAVVWIGAAFVAWLLCVGVLWALSEHSRTERRKGLKFGLSWVSVLFWAIAQIGCVLPLLISVLLLFLLPKWIAKAVGLFPERDLRQDGNASKGLFERLGAFARLPSRIMNGALTDDSPLKRWSDAADSQAAFYQMQNRGVDAGEEAAGLLRELVGSPGLENARLHLIGHSFGGLLVANSARALARNPAVPVHSLTFIEGAFASGWLDGEFATVKNVRRTISSLFSGYDSATGFYYPLANAARLSAGSVGLCDVPNALSGKGNLLAYHATEDPSGERDPRWCRSDCVKAHIHRPRPFASLADPPRLPGPKDALAVLNLDTSRMCYAGAVASGGAHTDIYKDDIVNLIWSAAHRESLP